MIYQVPPTFNISRTRIVSKEGTPEDAFALWMQTLVNQAVRAIPTASTFTEIPVRTNYYGELAWITDSDTNIAGTIIAGGGAFTVLGLWTGTNWIVLGGSGVGGAPGGLTTDVQYNDNGTFGGSVLHYDKTLNRFGLFTPAIADVLFYGLFENTTTDFTTGLEIDVTSQNDARAFGIYGFASNDGGAVTSGVTDFTGLFGDAWQVTGSCGIITGTQGTISIFAGSVSDKGVGVIANIRLLGGAINDAIAGYFGIEATAGTVARLMGVRIVGPKDKTATVSESYGLFVDDQTYAGVPAANNWAALFQGGSDTFGIKATGIPSVNGADGVSGTFTTVDLKTVTVTNGLITSIV